MTLFSSFSKGRPGFFGNRISDFGDYTQCIHATFNGSSSRYIMFQLEMLSSNKRHVLLSHQEPYYSSLDFNSLTPFPVIQAACLPSACQPQDIKAVIQHNIVKKLVHPLRMSLMSTESKSDENPFHEFYYHRLFAKLVLCSLISITFIATLCPNLFPRNSLIVDSWSLSRNNAKIFAETPVLLDERLYVLNAYKLVYLVSGVISHSRFFVLSFKTLPFLYSSVFDLIQKD